MKHLMAVLEGIFGEKARGSSIVRNVAYDKD
jgi:hypothetical protein